MFFVVETLYRESVDVTVVTSGDFIEEGFEGQGIQG